MRVVAVRMPDGLLEALGARADRLGCSVSAVIREACETHIDPDRPAVSEALRAVCAHPRTEAHPVLGRVCVDCKRKVGR